MLTKLSKSPEKIVVIDLSVKCNGIDSWNAENL